MIVTGFRCHNIGPFIGGPIDLDVSALPAGSVIAVMGTNGAGKSHLVELMGPGPLFQEFPSDRDATAKQGRPLASHVRPRHRDAYVEVDYLLGDRLLSVHLDIDGKTRKTEGYVTVDGERHGPLISQVKAQVAKHFGSRALFMIGPFACQGGFDAFSRVQQVNRRGVFAEMLGIGEYEVLHGRCEAHETQVLEELRDVRERLETATGRAEMLAEQRAALAAAVAEVERAVTALTTARAVHAAAIDDHQVARDALLRCQATASERARLEADLATIATRLQEAAGTLAELETTVIEGDAIRAAASRLLSLDDDLAAARAAERAAGEKLPACEAAVATASAERERLATDYRRLEAEREAAAAARVRVDALGSLTAQRSDLEQTRDRIGDELAAHDARTPDLTAAVATATDALGVLDGHTTEREEAAQTEAATVARRRELESRRAELLRRNTMLASIPNVDECGTCPLTTDIRDAMTTLAPVDAELAELPVIEGTPAADALAAHRRDRIASERARDRAQADERAHAAARTVLEQRRRTVEGEMAGLAEQIAAATADQELAAREPAAATAVESTRTQGLAAKATLDAAIAARDEARTALDTQRTRVSVLETERTTEATLAARLPELATAEARHGAVAAGMTTDQASRADLQRALDALPSEALVDAEAAVAAAAQTRDECAAAITEAEGAHEATVRTRFGLAAEVQTAGDPAAEATSLRTRETTLVRRAADLAVLKRPLSPKGIPALIIDGAGPVITARANRYIAEDYTPRFQIRLTTTRPLANGKGAEEVFDYVILDAEADRPEGSRGSGGEMALIDTALRLSIIIENVQRSGREFRTLFLDEPTAALSQENAPKYVSMIRHAMREGHFHHAWVVTHSPEVWEQADARVIVDKDERTARLFIPGATQPGEGIAA